jgi:hypothetical protein
MKIHSELDSHLRPRVMVTESLAETSTLSRVTVTASLTGTSTLSWRSKYEISLWQRLVLCRG